MTTSPKPGHVLHVVTGQAFSGIERQALSLIRAQRVAGCPAYLACPPSAVRLRTEAEAAGVPCVGGRGGPTWRWLLSLLRRTIREPTEVIHAHDGRSGPAAAVLALASGALFVRTQHFVQTASMTRVGPARRASLTAHRLVNRRLRGYLAVSQSVAAAAQVRGDIGRATLRVIPPAIDLPGADQLTRASVARASRTAPRVAFVGRLQEERELDVLLRAIPNVLTAVPNCLFTIAGSGPAEPDLRALADSLGVSSSITWPGWVADSYSVLADATAYVNTWPREAFGMAAAEAMTLGLPIVAANAGANVELVTDGVTGALFRPGDATDLARALIQVIADPDLASRMGATAQSQALAEFGAEKSARRTLAFYSELAGGTR